MMATMWQLETKGMEGEEGSLQLHQIYLIVHLRPGLGADHCVTVEAKHDLDRAGSSLCWEQEPDQSGLLRE